MDPEEAATPTRRQRWTALAGLPAVVLAFPIALVIFGRAALPWLLIGGGLVLTVLIAGVAGRALIARRFPIMEFSLDDLSGPAGQIEAAKARLAAGDHAAFTINAIRAATEPEAAGQIWIQAAKSGAIQMTRIELSYDWSTEPAEQPALAPLLSDGWEITRWEPNHWVLLDRPGDTSAAEAVRLVADTLNRLFDIPLSSPWTFRAFA